MLHHTPQTRNSTGRISGHRCYDVDCWRECTRRQARRDANQRSAALERNWEATALSGEATIDNLLTYDPEHWITDSGQVRISCPFCGQDPMIRGYRKTLVYYPESGAYWRCFVCDTYKRPAEPFEETTQDDPAEFTAALWNVEQWRAENHATMGEHERLVTLAIRTIMAKRGHTNDVPMATRALAKLCGLSHMTVHLVLRQLVADGIIECTYDGQPLGRGITDAARFSWIAEPRWSATRASRGANSRSSYKHTESIRGNTSLDAPHPVAAPPRRLMERFSMVREHQEPALQRLFREHAVVTHPDATNHGEPRSDDAPPRCGFCGFAADPSRYVERLIYGDLRRLHVCSDRCEATVGGYGTYEFADAANFPPLPSRPRLVSLGDVLSGGTDEDHAVEDAAPDTDGLHTLWSVADLLANWDAVRVAATRRC